MTPMDPPVPNWIASNITSSAVVNDGGLTPDGRSAWWVSTQTYESPYTPDRSHIYLRRIDPPLTNHLTVAISGEGAVARSPEGADLGGGVFEYVDLEVPGDWIRLEAMSDPGWRFDEWQQTDAQSGVIADVRLLSDRTVTAVFVPASAPNVSSLTITTLEDTVSSPAYPPISDADPEDQHTLVVDTEPNFGHVSVDSAGFIFTPEPDFAGIDGFTFHVVDRYGLSAAGTADVVVLPVNDPPTVGAEITVALQGGTFGPYMPAIVDPDPGDIHTIAVQSQPAHGTASADADGLYYTPNPGYVGADTFTFLVTDSAGASDSGSIQFNVLPPPAIAETVVQVAGSEFLLHIEELPAGFGYTVQFTENLDAGEWMYPPQTHGPVPPPNSCIASSILRSTCGCASNPSTREGLRTGIPHGLAEVAGFSGPSGCPPPGNLVANFVANFVESNCNPAEVICAREGAPSRGARPESPQRLRGGIQGEDHAVVGGRHRQAIADVAILAGPAGEFGVLHQVVRTGHHPA